MIYKTTLNGTIIKTGTFCECWRNLVEIFGMSTLAELARQKVSIEPMQ